VPGFVRLTRGRGGWGVVPGGNCGRGGKRLRHWVWAGIRFGSGEEGKLYVSSYNFYVAVLAFLEKIA